MEYDADAMFRGVAGVAAKGWKLVKLWGVRDDLRCTCGRPACTTPGKHPSGGDGWQHRATDNEESISRWFEDIEGHSRVNVGVRLGATSGIIDVEYDSPEAEQALKKYGLDKIDTPAYSSGRGVHRIFQHEDWMPDSGVVKVDGIEVRIGGGNAASQSVIPPSWHKSGKQYSWLPGKSPDDVNPARLPDEFREAILAASRRQGSGITAQARKALRSAEKAKEGGRHAFLVGIASKHASRIRRFTDEEREELVQTLLCVNAGMCEPPKGDAEVTKIAHDQFRHYQERASARQEGGRFRFEKYGLVWNYEERCWEPGDWRLTVVKSEPAEFKLRIPHPDGRKEPVVIRLSGEEWVTPKRVAVRILEATGSIDLLDPNPARWAKTWNGESVQSDSGGWESTRGLKCLLADEADEEIPPKDTNVSTYYASILLAYIDSIEKTVSGDGEEATKPKRDGKPKWIVSPTTGEWRLWVRWNETVEAAWKRASLGTPPPLKERAALRAAIAAESEEPIKQQSVVVDGRQGKWWTLTEAHVEALRKIADSI